MFSGVGLGEFFVPKQQGMGEYFAANGMQGMGEYFTGASGLGATPRQIRLNWADSRMVTEIASAMNVMIPGIVPVAPRGWSASLSRAWAVVAPVVARYIPANLGRVPAVSELISSGGQPTMDGLRYMITVIRRRQGNNYRAAKWPTLNRILVTYPVTAPVSGTGEYFSGTGGALVNWAHQEEAEHPGIFGMGEYFAANGLGDDAAPMAEGTKRYLMYTGGGLVLGLLASVALKKSKLAGAGIGTVLGAGAGYAATHMG